MNFFRGRLRDDAGALEMDSASLSLDGLQTSGLPLEEMRGRELVLGLRPEHLQRANTNASAASLAQFDATLEVVEPVGNEVFLNMRFGGVELVARVQPQVLPAPGATLRMTFDPSRLHAFDAETGRRIVA